MNCIFTSVYCSFLKVNNLGLDDKILFKENLKDDRVNKILKKVNTKKSIKEQCSILNRKLLSKFNAPSLISLLCKARMVMIALTKGVTSKI